MARQVIVSVMYEFEDERELASAQILNEGNIQFIKTQIAVANQRRATLDPDPNNYAAFIQTEAEIKGEIGAYQFLLDRHEDVITRLNSGPAPDRG